MFLIERRPTPFEPKVAPVRALPSAVPADPLTKDSHNCVRLLISVALIVALFSPLLSTVPGAKT